MIQSKKKYEVLDCLTSLVNAYGTFFKEGADLFVKVEPESAAITKDIGEMKRISALLEKHLVNLVFLPRSEYQTSYQLNTRHRGLVLWLICEILVGILSKKSKIWTPVA